MLLLDLKNFWKLFSGFVPKLVARLAIIEQINIIALNS